LEVENKKKNKKKKLEQKKQNGGENKKKPLIREGPHWSSIAELIDNLSKNPDVSFFYIVCY
jgi:hypothetical protein